MIISIVLQPILISEVGIPACRGRDRGTEVYTHPRTRTPAHLPALALVPTPNYPHPLTTTLTTTTTNTNTVSSPASSGTAKKTTNPDHTPTHTPTVHTTHQVQDRVWRLVLGVGRVRCSRRSRRGILRRTILRPKCPSPRLCKTTGVWVKKATDTGLVGVGVCGIIINLWLPSPRPRPCPRVRCRRGGLRGGGVSERVFGGCVLSFRTICFT